MTALTGQKDSPVSVAQLGNCGPLLLRAQGWESHPWSRRRCLASKQVSTGLWPWAAGTHLLFFLNPMQNTGLPETSPQHLAQRGCKQRVQLTFPLPVSIGARLRSQSQRNAEQARSRHRICSRCCAGVTPLKSSARTCGTIAGVLGVAASLHGSKQRSCWL